MHHGVRVHPDILCGKSTGPAGHSEATVQAQEATAESGQSGGGKSSGGRGQPVGGRVADDQLHLAARTAVGDGRPGRGGWPGAGLRVPVAARHASERDAAGDCVRLRQRREHQRREQRRRQGHAEGVHHAGQPPTDGERRPEPVPVQRGRGRRHGQRAGTVVFRLGPRPEMRRGQAGQVATVQADIRWPEVGQQGGGVGQVQARHAGHGPRVRVGGGRSSVVRVGYLRFHGRAQPVVAAGRATAAPAQAEGPGAREAAHRPQEGEARHAHSGPDHGLIHRVLASVLLHVHTDAAVFCVPHPGSGVYYSLLAGLHELGHQSGYLHDIQQGLPAQLPARAVQVKSSLPRGTRLPSLTFDRFHSSGGEVMKTIRSKFPPCVRLDFFAWITVINVFRKTVFTE